METLKSMDAVSHVVNLMLEDFVVVVLPLLNLNFNSLGWECVYTLSS